jgi:ubiquitin carboxyl-terminal hydrolase 7
MFMKLFRLSYNNNNGNKVIFKLKVSVEEGFIAAHAPVGYNSKENTGMVGLENLGATCYLNALLQVYLLFFI